MPGFATTCAECGRTSRVSFGGANLCDRCFDDRVAEQTGFGTLPHPPAEEVLTGPDGREHPFAYRLWRAPTGIVAEVEELGHEVSEGYHAEVRGSHGADPAGLLERLRSRLRDAVGRLDLEVDETGRVRMAGDELRGRLVWNEDGGPCHVIVDGRRMSWEDLGRALNSFEGWHFRLLIEDAEVFGDAAATETAEPPKPRLPL